MSQQAIDPLADTLPPRHAYESDDEDDEPRASLVGQSIEQTEDVDVQVRIADALAGERSKIQKSPLVIVTGSTGKAWVGGVQVGSTIGGIFVHGVEVGTVYRPPWAKSVVIVSEITTKLSIQAMHAYAEAILDFWDSESVMILDSYSVASYIAGRPTSLQSAPTRILSNGSLDALRGSSHLEPFAVPNTLQSTTSAFLSILSLPTQGARRKASAILLPSRHTVTFSRASEASHWFTNDFAAMDNEWTSSTLEAVHAALFDDGSKWHRDDKVKMGAVRKANLGSTDTSMYL